MSAFDIIQIMARSIVDSRGFPTVEAEVHLAGGAVGRAAVPSGASVGRHEAHELRDGGKVWLGKGVHKAVAHVNGEIAASLQGMAANNQAHIDAVLCELDGTANKKRLGANAILAVSLGVAQAAAAQNRLPLWQYMGGAQAHSLPVPMMNILNGGAHADNTVDIQEFMIVPWGAASMWEAVRMGAEVFHALKLRLKKSGYATGLGDEGGFAPDLPGNTAALDMILQAIADAGLKTGRGPTSDMVLALDPAASEFHKKGKYVLAGEGKTLTRTALIDWYVQLCRKYPIVSLEDAIGETDQAGWQSITKRLGADVQLVGDDVFVTNSKRLQDGIARTMANAILVKINQCGTLSEAIRVVQLAHANGYRTVMSHRSGETEDTAIADLAVALNCGQIKIGSLARSERLAKYNQLLRIAEGLPKASYAGRAAFAC